MKENNVSIIIPTQNNLEYLKLAYDSIRKYYTDEIVILDDRSDDGTLLWAKKQSQTDKNLKIFYNNNDSIVGHTILYDVGVENAKNEIIAIFHADMVMLPNFFENMLKYLQRGIVVSSTRIEPGIHPNSGEKVIYQNAPLYPSGFDFMKLMDFYFYVIDKYRGFTKGIFAPWMMYKSDYQNINGHDHLFSPYPYEDSDIFNRMKIAGYDFIQSWESFVYHFTCRGHKWKEKIGEVHDDYEYYNKKNLTNFLRKWKTFPLNDENMYPYYIDVYNVGIVINKESYITENDIRIIEPIFDTIYFEDFDNHEFNYDNLLDISHKIKKFDYDDNKEINNDVLVFSKGNLKSEQFFSLRQHFYNILNKKMKSGNKGVFSIVSNDNNKYFKIYMYNLSPITYQLKNDVVKFNDLYRNIKKYI